MKKFWISAVILLGLSAIFLTGCGKKTVDGEQEVYAKTLQISKDYVALRHRSDQLLLNAREYSYDSWNAEMDQLLVHWTTLAQDAQSLEKLSNKTMLASTTSIGNFSFGKVYAYDSYEVSNIFDKAPAGKKIATLAQHLGVDAKRAFQILQQAQAGITADAWNEAGDTFQKLETSAVVIKDGCKVAGFVGGIAVGGGVAALAGKSLLTQAAVVVGGADLVLEVTDDAATIALGNDNKVSSLVGGVRTVTEPLANVLSITDIPNNLESGFDKFSAVMIALESFRGTVQEGNMIGISLPAYQSNHSKNIESQDPIVISTFSPEVLNDRLAATQQTTLEAVAQSDQKMLEELFAAAVDAVVEPAIAGEALKIEKLEKPVKSSSSDALIGYREGEFTRVASAGADPQGRKRIIEFEENGSFKTLTFAGWEGDTIPRRTQEGKSVKIYDLGLGFADEFFEFSLQGDSLVFLGLAGFDENGEYSIIPAGSDFLRGTLFEGTLKKVK